MRTRIKIAWKTLFGNMNGIVFFFLTERDQKALIENEETVDVHILYLGLDKKVTDKIVKRLERPAGPDDHPAGKDEYELCDQCSGQRKKYN